MNGRMTQSKYLDKISKTYKTRMQIEGKVVNLNIKVKKI
jgi:hypothetical protein